jgi:hypothetical protein
MSKVSTNMEMLIGHLQDESETIAQKAILRTFMHCRYLEHNGISLESKTYEEVEELILEDLGYA